MREPSSDVFHGRPTASTGLLFRCTSHASPIRKRNIKRGNRARGSQDLFTLTLRALSLSRTFTGKPVDRNLGLERGLHSSRGPYSRLRISIKPCASRSPRVVASGDRTCLSIVFRTERKLIRPYMRRMSLPLRPLRRVLFYTGYFSVLLERSSSYLQKSGQGNIPMLCSF
jgi:hypothetical protein